MKGRSGADRQLIAFAPLGQLRLARQLGQTLLRKMAPTKSEARDTLRPLITLAWWAIVLVLAALGLTPSVSVASSAADSAAGRFFDFISSQELVFTGTVVAIVSNNNRATVGGACMGSTFYDVLDTRLAVDAIWSGAIDDSLVEVSLIGQDGFGGQMPDVGARLLVWAERECSDSWRLYGSAVKIEHDGSLTPRDSDGGTFRLPGPRPRQVVTVDMVKSAETRRRAAGTGSWLVDAFAGASALGLGVLRGAAYRDDGTSTMACDSVAWVLGSAATMPSALICPRRDDCASQLAIGDTLLIPVVNLDVTGRVQLSACSEGLRVSGGFVPALGVSVGGLDRALAQSHTGLRVRPVLAKK